MYSQERKAEIINLLTQQTSVSVSVLAQTLRTSKETIRRDLSDLEADGILSRTHGGAILNSNPLHVSAGAKYHTSLLNNEYPFAQRHARNIPAKKKIAQKAASLIQDKDTIFIDNSSTTLFLMDYIPRNIQLTIITNSINVLLESAKIDNPHLSLISLAGFYNCTNYSLYGSRTIRSAAEFYPDKSFFSCTGVSLDKLLTDISLHEVDTKQAMMEKSRENYLLVDHTKFETASPFFLSSYDRIDCIITDKYDYPESVSRTLETITSKHNVRILIN
ncbi:DeoR/GlpR family DNA-binding transcription regulator [Suipraeoptans intestinalis]|uniref:DeoR/GlpR family DNA-binding transcription regulator n=1 Tax=Suipraeoptans intestinalis TaxID=2606628 RepID=UPI002A75D4FF|nr:DeoR/GlpR family DNA-binding transcription regulator [Suipraeoptans intestinalis]MDY3121591.1 DeoR/GlpR family DNA-binding transcription regulator [Suipraeoptans intestinalis]